MLEANKPTRVFLPWMPDNPLQRIEMVDILVHAGLEVIPGYEYPKDELTFIQVVKEAISEADCSIHIINTLYGKTLEADGNISLARFQFNEAKAIIAKKPDFKIFIWYPSQIVGEEKEARQEEFINEIRHGITANMIFTSIASPIQLVDDIRSMMEKEVPTHFDVNDTEVFVMFNELDEGEAEGIIDMLSDIISVEKLNIIQDSNIDYSELCFNQIGKSKLAVVYFKETSDWALPFVQQVWKKVGGASASTPLLLIGDEDPDTNRNMTFKAPRVVSLIVAGELIPLEIKMQFDKLIGSV